MKVLLKADGRTAAGGSALLMHNMRLADPLDPFQRAIGSIAKKRNKTEADLLEIARLEFLGGLYTDPEMPTPDDVDGNTPVIPAFNILRCLQGGATKQKRGKDVLRGVFPLATQAPLEYDGPRQPDELWKAGGFFLRETVGVQRSRTVRTRPMFTDWQAALEAEVDSEIFDIDTLRVAWKDAGIREGLGDKRPVQGRFCGSIEVIEK